MGEERFRGWVGEGLGQKRAIIGHTLGRQFMTKTERTCLLWLVWIPLACSSKSPMKWSTGGDAGNVPSADAALADTLTIIPDDAKATLPDLLPLPDLAVAPDGVTHTPDDYWIGLDPSIHS